MTSTQRNSAHPYAHQHIKRPLNPFMVFSQLERKLIIERNPDMHNANISKELGARWKAMEKEERAPYEAEAKRLQLEHSRMYPDYRFQPRKKPKKNADGTDQTQVKAPTQKAKTQKAAAAAQQATAVPNYGQMAQGSYAPNGYYQNFYGQQNYYQQQEVYGNPMIQNRYGITMPPHMQNPMMGQQFYSNTLPSNNQVFSQQSFSNMYQQPMPAHSIIPNPMMHPMAPPTTFSPESTGTSGYGSSPRSSGVSPVLVDDFADIFPTVAKLPMYSQLCWDDIYKTI